MKTIKKTKLSKQEKLLNIIVTINKEEPDKLFTKEFLAEEHFKEGWNTKRNQPDLKLQIAKIIYLVKELAITKGFEIIAVKKPTKTINSTHKNWLNKGWVIATIKTKVLADDALTYKMETVNSVNKSLIKTYKRFDTKKLVEPNLFNMGTMKTLKQKNLNDRNIR